MNMIAQAILPFLHQFAANCGNKPTFFGLKPWYYYLQVTSDPTTGQCEISNFKLLGSDSSFLAIGMVVLDDLLRVAALVAVGFVIYGGITYATSQGDPSQTSQAQQTIINALIGLVVALLASGFVAYVGTKLV